MHEKVKQEERKKKPEGDGKVKENKENERQTSLTKNLFKVDSLTKLFIFVKMAGTLRFAIHWLKCDIYVFAKFIAKLMTFKF